MLVHTLPVGDIADNKEGRPILPARTKKRGGAFCLGHTALTMADGVFESGDILRRENRLFWFLNLLGMRGSQRFFVRRRTPCGRINRASSKARSFRVFKAQGAVQSAESAGGVGKLS